MNYAGKRKICNQGHKASKMNEKLHLKKRIHRCNKSFYYREFILKTNDTYNVLFKKSKNDYFYME